MQALGRGGVSRPWFSCRLLTSTLPHWPSHWQCFKSVVFWASRLHERALPAILAGMNAYARVRAGGAI